MLLPWPQQLAGCKLLISCCSTQTQEMWSCFIPLTLFFCNSGMAHKLPLLFLVGHYAYRSFVFPFWLQQPKPTPLHVWVAACVFVVYNGILQVGPPVHQQCSGHPGRTSDELCAHLKHDLFLHQVPEAGSKCLLFLAFGSVNFSACLLLCREHSWCTAGMCK